MAAAIFVIEIDEVFDESIVFAPAIESSFSNICFLTSKFSVCRFDDQRAVFNSSRDVVV